MPVTSLKLSRTMKVLSLTLSNPIEMQCINVATGGAAGRIIFTVYTVGVVAS